MFLCDFHVHVYDCFCPDRAIGAAADNFASIIRSHRLDVSSCFLFLTESGDHDWFGDVCRGKAGLSNWQVEVTGEANSLVLVRDTARMVVVAGRQVMTSEGIEVLSLGSAIRPDDGLPLAETVEQVISHDGLPVLPWGVGKWLGRRGRIVYDFFNRAGKAVLPGDNGGRPPGWPEPAVFSLARQEGIPILPGSDPLPIPGEEKRIGTYCGLVRGHDRRGETAGWLCSHLRAGGAVEPMGRRISLITFFINQIALRLRQARRP